MRKILTLLISVLLLACGNDTIENDSNWAVEYMQQFKEGMHLEYVYKVLRRRKDEVKFYNNCIDEFEYPMKACDKGYNLVTTIKLPGHDKSLGKGDLQMYFNFNSQQQLTSTMHELYYPAHH